MIADRSDSLTTDFGNPCFPCPSQDLGKARLRRTKTRSATDYLSRDCHILKSSRRMSFLAAMVRGTGRWCGVQVMSVMQCGASGDYWREGARVLRRRRCGFRWMVVGAWWFGAGEGEGEKARQS